MDASMIPRDAKAVTPDNDADCNGIGFMVGTTGAVAVETYDGTTVTLPACQAGFQYSMSFRKILATGTAATTIVRFI